MKSNFPSFFTEISFSFVYEEIVYTQKVALTLFILLIHFFICKFNIYERFPYTFMNKN